MGNIEHSRIVLGVGHSGTSAVARIHQLAGWGYDSPAPYAGFVEPHWLVPASGMLTRHRRGTARPDDMSPAECIAHVQAGFAAAPRPAIVKDPRLVLTLGMLRDALLAVERGCELLYLTRNKDDVAASFRRRNQIVDGEPGLYGATLPTLTASAKAAFLSWPGEKFHVEYEWLSTLIRSKDWRAVSEYLRIPEEVAEASCREFQVSAILLS